MLMGAKYQSGEGVFQSDTKALELYVRAAELGHAEAYAVIAIHYQTGAIAVEQDMSKTLAFYEVAAKKGSILVFHGKNGNTHERMKHMKILASAGHQVDGRL